VPSSRRTSSGEGEAGPVVADFERSRIAPSRWLLRRNGVGRDVAEHLGDVDGPESVEGGEQRRLSARRESVVFESLSAATLTLAPAAECSPQRTSRFG
jgi:hypothetical protein